MFSARNWVSQASQISFGASFVQGGFFDCSALKNDEVSDYIVNPIKKVSKCQIFQWVWSFLGRNSQKTTLYIFLLNLLVAQGGQGVLYNLMADWRIEQFAFVVPDSFFLQIGLREALFWNMLVQILIQNC